VSDRPQTKAPIVPPKPAGRDVWPVMRPVGSSGSSEPSVSDADTGSSVTVSPDPISPPNAPPPRPVPNAPGDETQPGGLIAEALDLTSEVVAAVGDVVSRRLTGSPPDTGGPDVEMEIDPDATRSVERSAGIRLDCGMTDKVQHVGMIFVHGIGSQAAGETLRDWGAAIIRVLAQFRIGEGEPADPVVKTQLDPTSGKALYIEIELPAIKDKHGKVQVQPEHWVMTEAWWAQRLSPPPFSQMAQWLGPGGAVRRIVTAMFAAQGRSDPRQREASEAHLLKRPKVEEDGERKPVPLSTIERAKAWPMLSQPVDIAQAREAARQADEAARQAAAAAAEAVGADGAGARTQRRVKEDREPGSALRPGPLAALFEKFGVGLFLQAVSALVLLLYGFLRSIEKLLPIGPLKGGALTRPIDNFLLNWFGDVHILLGDPAQSASVRARLVDAIWDLEAVHCEPITIVAHSGGAIVTYLTLADPVTSKLRVDRVVTHGEGANLAWRLTSEGGLTKQQVEDKLGPADVYGDLYRSITNRTWPVLWTDMWASQDPAPVGLMNFPRVDLATVESIGVWNRLSFREDHGTYWENDEEFVIPLLRRLVGTRKDPSSNRFGSDDAHFKRSQKRRQRIAVLSFWSQFCRALPTIAVVHWFAFHASALSAAATSAAGGTVAAAGELATSVWNTLPGHEIVSDPLAQLRTDMPDGFPSGSFGDGIAQIGVWVIALVLASAAIFTLRAPPERSSLFRSFPWNGYDVFYAVALRFAVLYLLVLAAEEFVRMKQSDRPPPIVPVIIVFALAALEVGLARLLERLPEKARGRRRDLGRSIRKAIDGIRESTRWPSWITFGLPTAAIAILLAGSVLVVVAPFVAMATFPKTANVVLGTIVIFISFQLLLAVGKWRWSAWDQRERIETQRRKYRAGSNWAVGLQMSIHMLAAVLLYFGIVAETYQVGGMSLILLAVIAIAAAVLVGVGIDVVTANNRRAQNNAEGMTQMMRT
jgi:hypothetical protein